MSATILLADDDKAICTVLEHAIRRMGYEALVTDNGGKLLEWVEQGKGDAVITDILMPGMNGLDLLPRIKARRPDLPVIVISAQNTLLTAVKANQLGAYDYIPKPFDLSVLMDCVKKSMTLRKSVARGEPASEKQASSYIIGRSPAMQEIYRTIARVVGIDLTVMIAGESGTGKELVARALHNLGPRKHKSFVPLNMAAIPKELIESELFGHEKGAFTGALARKAGVFEQAEGGTLFLDEIGDMPLQAQTRLLRVLQQGEYTPVGSTRPQPANVRIITATHRDLVEQVRKEAFREDLYYRLNVVQIKIPPLRERTEDINELVTFFLGKGVQKGLPRKEIAPAALPILESYRWPGNVRELEYLVYRLMTLYSEPVIDATILRKEMAGSIDKSPESRPLPEIIREHIEQYFKRHGHDLPQGGVYDRLMPLFEQPLLEATLAAVGGNQVKAARILGINRNTLRKKMLRHDIESPRPGTCL